ESALTELESIYKANPTDRRARTTLVQQYIKLKKTAQAEQVLAAALKQNPKDTDALLQRSELYMWVGKPAEAEIDLQSVLHFQPQSAEAHYVLAAVEHARSRKQLERQELSEAIRLNPRLWAARLALSRNFNIEGHSTQALEVLDQNPKPPANVPFFVERN